jgi:hypothetical protein
MKKNSQKKLQLSKIKIASLSPLTTVSNGKNAISTASLVFICPTICTGT